MLIEIKKITNVSGSVADSGMIALTDKPLSC